MSPMVAAIVVFVLMWAGILFSAYHLFTWLFRLDREVREGTAPIEPGL